jgi:hypothetical protein
MSRASERHLNRVERKIAVRIIHFHFQETSDETEHSWGDAKRPRLAKYLMTLDPWSIPSALFGYLHVLS